MQPIYAPPWLQLGNPQATQMGGEKKGQRLSWPPGVGCFLTITALSCR